MPPAANLPDDDTPRNRHGFIDPARRPWVWAGFALLLAGLLPVWPIEGWWWGIPGWAVFAVLMSVATSAFTVFVLLKGWRDDDTSPEEPDGI
ncbi:MAG: hypothetical protein JSU88_03185 [Nitrospinaceae bacterium]|jgi:fatty acid desaturase|nr:MAG: hypothetical protein JSU88_03185 [Nitrospinaceae bacterium]